MAKVWRVAGINFEHFHMGDLLLEVARHPRAEIAAVCDEDPARVADAARRFGLRPDQVFTDYRACMEHSRPDWVLLCPATAGHADWTERIAPYRVPVLMEKPFAATLAEADRMIAAMGAAGPPLAINWPLRWYPAHATAYRLVSEGAIGEVTEVHFYDGNRGPLWHGAEKIELEPTAGRKAASWFYKRDQGGGSLLDYLGYGATLGTWYLGGRTPLEITCVADEPAGLEVDEHSITIARYAFGLSKFETRWGTFTDPWTAQPQPKCGFVLRGTEGTLSSYDFEPTVRLQTREKPGGFDLPVDTLPFPLDGAVAYFLDCLETGRPVDGPLSVEISRIGQQIVDTAAESARRKCALPLLESSPVPRHE